MWCRRWTTSRLPWRPLPRLWRSTANCPKSTPAGTAFAAIEPAVQIYRRLTIEDRNAYLPSLAAALTRQADELGHLDRITEARAAIAEARMISTDMLPSTQS
jgi:hypothetical protein